MPALAHVLLAAALAVLPSRCPRSGPPPCHEVARAVGGAGGLRGEALVYDCGSPDLLLNGRITNTTADPVLLDRTMVHFPMLVFELRDSAGARVPGGPPPVPPRDGPDLHVLLPPNGDLTWDATLSGVAPALPPGIYDLRLVYESAPGKPRGDWAGRLMTGWARITVR